MVLAVSQGHHDVDHLEAERAALQIVADAGFDRRDVLLGHDAAGDGVVELEPGAAGLRLDVDMDVAELAVATALLLVAGMLRHRLADGFLVRNLRPLCRGRNAEPVLDAVHDDLQMLIALARNDQLACIRIGRESQRRILLDDLGQRARQLDFVGTLLGPHRQRIERGQRLRPSLRRHVAGRRQGGAGLDRIHAGESDDVAGHRLGHLFLLLAEQLEHAAGPVAVEGGSLGDLAADHPRHGKLAGMGRVQGLEDLGHRLAVRLQAEARRDLTDLGRLVAQDLEQAGNAVVVLGGAEQDRHHVAAL